MLPRRLLVLLVAACLPLAGLLLPAGIALAQPVLEPPAPASLQAGDVPDEHKRPRVVAILPIRNDLVSIADLFNPDAPRAHEPSPETIEALIARVLVAHPFVVVQGSPQVRQNLSQDKGMMAQAQVAQERYRLGLDLYMSLATARAALSLEAATATYRAIFQDVVDPRPYADAQFMLGITQVDLGRLAEGHIALKDAFALQPARRFRPHYHPPPVQSALAAALVDHLSTADPIHPYGDNARMHELAGRLGVPWLILGSLRPGKGSGQPELHLAIFSAQRRLIEAELRVPVTEAGVRVEAFLSRWLACVPVAVAQPGGAAPTRDLRIDTSGSYAPYLRQPTRKAFHSLGFGAGVASEVRPGLEWFGRVNMYTSLSDPNRDLLHPFNSVRLLGGLGFTVRRGPLRLYARPGVDLHVLGNFVAATDPDCKLFGVGHKLCDQGDVADLDQRLLAGLNLALGGNVHLGRNFFLLLQGSLSTYFLPLDGTDRLNFPLAAEIGLGYRL